MERWASDTRDLPPRIQLTIYCSISGWTHRPDAHLLPGCDYVMQGRRRHYEYHRAEPTDPPSKVGVAIVDLTAGCFNPPILSHRLYACDLTRPGPAR